MDADQFLTRRHTDQTRTVSARYYFHEDWYRATYLNNGSISADPWDHYVLVGERSGAMPHPLFCPTFYRQQSGDHGGLALDHYARFGVERMIHPHPLLRPENPDQDLHWFETHDCQATSHLVRPRNQESHEPNGSVALRYLLASDEDWQFPNPLFDRAWYRSAFTSEIEPYGDPLAHYLAVGGHRGVATGQHIVWESFLERRPDLLLQAATPLEHVLQHEPAYSFTFGRQRPEWLIVDALEAGLSDDARALLAAWSLTAIDEWCHVALTSGQQYEVTHVLEVGGCLLTTDGVVGTLHGEPTVRYSPGRFILSDRGALVRRSPSPAVVDDCLLLIHSPSSQSHDIRSCAAMALKTGAQIVTDWETAAGLEAASLALNLSLTVVVPNDLTCVTRRITPNDDTKNLEGLSPHDVSVRALGRTSSNSFSSITHGLTAQGLVALMSLLPTHSRIAVSDPLNLSPATRRNLARVAQERGLVLELSEAVST